MTRKPIIIPPLRAAVFCATTLAVAIGANAVSALMMQELLMSRSGGAGQAAQSIASVSLSNSTFTNSTSNAVVGTVAVVMNPASPAFSGSLSLTGVNSGGFHLVGTTLETNAGGTTSGTYSDVNIVATQAGVGGSPAQITPTLTGSSGVACAIGPNSPSGPTGVAATDAITAGFTTCALNSDFGTPTFADITSWLGNTTSNTCYTPSNPIWYRVNEPPCSDFTIITDNNGDAGASGTQVFDLRLTAADVASTGSAEVVTVNFLGGSGSLYSTGLYVEYKFRVTTLTTHAYDTGGQGRIFESFKVPPAGPFLNYLEWDFAEQYFHPTGMTGAVNCGSVPTKPYPCGVVPPLSMQYSNYLSATDMANYHIYGNLITNDGGTAMSDCWYLDGNKLGCENFTGFNSAESPFASLQQLIIQSGLDSAGASFTGPADVLLQYFRVFTCPAGSGLTASAQTGPTCSGTLVTG